MPLFDITSGIKAQYTSGATPQVAYDIVKKVVVTFAKRGYTVTWLEQKPPALLIGKLGDKDGTDLVAECKVIDEGTTTRCDINIKGHVFLGGLLGRLVSASTIQSRAQEKIREMLDEQFAGQPKKRAPLAPAAPAPKPAAPAPAAPAPKAPAAPAPAPTTTTAPAPAPAAKDEPWAVLADKPGVAVDVLVKRAAAAAGALGDPTLIQFVQIGLVQAFARHHGQKLDRAAASALLSRVAPSVEQAQMAGSTPNKLAGTTAAFALTAALGEVLAKHFGDKSVTDDVLRDVFGAAFERIRGEKTAAHKDGAAAVVEKLAQVQEAYDADLISEGELLTLKERVLVSL